MTHYDYIIYYIYIDFPCFFLFCCCILPLTKISGMDEVPFNIRKHIFNTFKFLDRKLSHTEIEFKQRRDDRIIAFRKFCPQCHYSLRSEYCPVCQLESAIPNYCKSCDSITDMDYCPQCNGKIYFHKVNAGIKAKDFTIFPN